jgi:hypothetical protein
LSNEYLDFKRQATSLGELAAAGDRRCLVLREVAMLGLAGMVIGRPLFLAATELFSGCFSGLVPGTFRLSPQQASS